MNPNPNDLKFVRNYYIFNKNHFYDLAHYYGKNDVENYKKYFLPYINLDDNVTDLNLLPQGVIQCPFCKKYVLPKHINKTHIGGIIFMIFFLVIAGFFFLGMLSASFQKQNASVTVLFFFSALFAGISFIGLAFKSKYVLCPKCNMKIQ